jgi:hypothetical protein
VTNDMQSWLKAISLAGILAAGCVGAVSVGLHQANQVEGSGTLQTETRKVGDFSGLDVSGIINAKLTIGEKTSVMLSGDDNLLPLIETNVRDGRLEAKFKDNTGITTQQTLLLTVTTPRIESLIARGTSRIDATGIAGKALTVDASDTSNLTLKEVTSDAVTIKAEGVSRVTLAGKGPLLTLDFSGATRLDSIEFHALSVKAKMAGAAQAEVQASTSVEGSIVDAGNLRVRGNPANRTVTTSGAGRVTYETTVDQK